MKRKFLLDLGIDEELSTKILNEYTKSISSLHNQVTDLTTERDEYKGRLETKESEYTTLGKSLSTKTKEYDTLKSESDKNTSLLVKYQNKDTLIGLGVDSKYVDFVSHEVASKRGEKNFKEFAESYLKENAHYKAGNTQKITTQPNLNGGNEPSKEGNVAINNAIRHAAGRQ